MRERERERGGLRRACELSSGRRRHWKNRTEINRSVFFAELEHELSLSLVLPQFSRALVLVPLAFRRPTRLASPYHPTSIPLPPIHPGLLLVFQHFSFLPPLLLLPRLAPFLSQAPGVYSVIARPSRTTALDFRRRSPDFHLIPPFPRSISFRTTSLLCLPSSSYARVAYLTLPRINYYMVLLALHYQANCTFLLTFITTRMFSSIINIIFSMQSFFLVDISTTLCTIYKLQFNHTPFKGTERDLDQSDR